MSVVLNILVLVAWIAAARWLYRYWVKNDTLTVKEGTKRVPMRHGVLAVMAAIAALCFPVVAIFAAIMWRTPVGRIEREERIRELTAENEKLRKEQENDKS